MKQVVNIHKKTEYTNRLAVLRMELDYELATLYEAMIEENEEQKLKSKQKLEELRQELLKYSEKKQ
ncbi:hypothetical protein [Priestia filamentosa]|uniref:Uncharacterized protein n=1 Tax=Priestia filamentosa TaxID=1402861 RepID=A0A1X7F1B5_9BACI|nr:hypothetical protein [Priestia filamentosa]AKO91563.1 hypothetical protein BEH_05270 [Priestia filamentosa]MDT3761666.1 hypothetical protein [Priestia filamentosa]OXS67764.1 hypothetical protein B1B01_14390 [Priestia filamentosa]RJS65033.1 hypothetical protein CJ485_09795 [Priestia filamentosa]WCM16766.1 hypothetical protein PGN40_05300 [Priestia filamentosa]